MDTDTIARRVFRFAPAIRIATRAATCIGSPRPREIVENDEVIIDGDSGGQHGPFFALPATSNQEWTMTLTRLIDSLTGRDASAPEAAPARRSTPSSSPDVGALMHSSLLLFVPAREGEHALGAQREVRERIADVLPGVVFDEHGHGAFTRTGYSVAFDTGSEDYVHAVSVEVTGGAAAMPPLARLISKTGWRLVPQAADPR
jgi:hypothetical protein